MKTVVGIFGSSSAADAAATNLVNAGVPPARIRQLTPGSSERQIHSGVPTSETEQAGMGSAVGGVVGGATGATAVLVLAALSHGSVGGLTTASLLFAALGAAVGAAIGAFAGGALEDKLSPGLPKDEIYFYEEALRRGRSVVFVFASNGRQEEIARRTLGRAGADSLDAGDENWRIGLEVPQGVHRGASRRRAG
jgi:hypothetical protein